jgi:hypothetical protein
MSCKRLFIVLVLAIVSHCTMAQTFEEKRTLSRTFKVVPSAMVEVNNKYGTVVVSTWDKDSVRIEATIQISEKSEERFKKMKGNINVNVTASPTHVLAETALGAKHSSLIQNVKEVTNFLSATDARSRIDYKVFVGRSANIKITNKYGDVVMPSLNGNVTIDLSNGNMQARELDGQTNLNLAFGTAQIKRIRQGQVALNFVNFTCDQSTKLTIDAKSSQLSIDHCDQVQLTSRRDQISIGNATSISGETYFSKLKLLSVTDAVDLKLTYGELSTLRMSANFKKCTLQSQMCDVSLLLQSPLAYNALIKAVRSQTSFPAGLKSSLPNAQKLMETQPVRFVFEKTLPDTKININISDAELKIDHQ